MPLVGDIKRAKELGFSYSGLYIYVACPSCGAERWVRKQNVGRYRCCVKCGVKKMGQTNRGLLGREVKYASELGKTPKQDYLRYQDFCPDCGKELWHRLKYIGAKCVKCANVAKRGKCTGAKNPRFKGYRRINHSGYIEITLQPDHPYFCMATRRDHRVMEHRLVVAQHLGRCLEAWEIVHHKGVKYPKGSIENKQDNRYPENLELLLGQLEHMPSIAMERHIRALEKQVKELQGRVTLLEAENILLKAQEGVNI